MLTLAEDEDTFEDTCRSETVPVSSLCKCHSFIPTPISLLALGSESTHITLLS